MYRKISIKFLIEFDFQCLERSQERFNSKVLENSKPTNTNLTKSLDTLLSGKAMKETHYKFYKSKVLEIERTM